MQDSFRSDANLGSPRVKKKEKGQPAFRGPLAHSFKFSSGEPACRERPRAGRRGAAPGASNSYEHLERGSRACRARPRREAKRRSSAHVSTASEQKNFAVATLGTGLRALTQVQVDQVCVWRRLQLSWSRPFFPAAAPPTSARGAARPRAGLARSGGRARWQAAHLQDDSRDGPGSVQAEHVWERHAVEKPEAPPNRGEGVGAAQAGEEGGRGDHLPGGEGGKGLRPNHHAYSGSEQ